MRIAAGAAFFLLGAATIARSEAVARYLDRSMTARLWDAPVMRLSRRWATSARFIIFVGALLVASGLLTLVAQ